ncbi:MAG: exosome complex RNA-binding protein Csl4 [Thermoprotei archaeon]
MSRKTHQIKNLGIYMPGTPVGVIEEFLPGEGLIEDNGYIYTIGTGEVELDLSSRIARLRPIKKPLIPKINDIVIAVILDHNKDHANVKIIGIEKSRESIIDVELDGLLLLRSRKNPLEIRNYDIIRAKVTADTIPLVLEINDKKLGLIYALCPQCPGELVIKGKKIVCSQCGFVDNRKPEEPNWFRKIQ